MLARFAGFRPLFEAFHGAGFQLFIVGGCVRDVVMGRDRIGDVDLATDARPEDTTRVLEGAGFKAIPIGEVFGTITTLVGGATVEITTFRVGEVYERGSRHPRVEFGTDIRADLSRRDLSINAMAMGADGEIIDPFDGRDAIAEGRLEVPGGGYENTISILEDDPLRLLRIARFAARFGYVPTDDTTRAAVETAPELIHISHERWKMEMDKLLVGGRVDVGLAWLHRVGGLRVVLPSAASLDDVAIERVAKRLDAVPAEPVLRWAVLLLSCMVPARWTDALPDEDARASLASQTGRRFRFSNRERKALIAVATMPLSIDALRGEWPDASLRRFYVDAPDHAFDRVYVARALVDGDPEGVAACDRLLAGLERVTADGDPSPALPSGLGRILRERFSLAGPDIGLTMNRIKDAILDGDLPNGADIDTYLAFVRDELAAS